MADPFTKIEQAYDPETFRAQARAVVDVVAEHLRGTGAREGKVAPMGAPQAELAAWASAFAGGEDPVTLLTRTLAASTHLHHPGYVGHQVSAPLPMTAVSSMISALLNNGMAVFEMGPVSSAMERALLGWMAAKAGFPAGADGLFTSGGSLGNLTALLAARRRVATRLGVDELPGAVIACEEAHYSTARAVGIMGWGRAGLVTVPADERFRMRADALEDAFSRAEGAGRKVVAVVASACSTSTGAFDPIEAIADVCARHDTWLHVDGAHGASFLASETHRGKLAGVERADSLVWDAHKMMLCPALVTAVLFKDGRDSFAAFNAPETEYLFDPAARHDTGLRTLECTKTMMALQPYLALAVHGEAGIAAYLDRSVALAQRFAARLAATPGFVVAVPPECNIVCFRHEGADMDEVRRRIVDQGDFYLVRTKLRGVAHLRTTILNPLTSEDDLDRLVDAVARASR